MFETRFPHITRPAWADALRQQGTTYPVTGTEEVKNSVNRTPPPPPPTAAGVRALEAEIAANTARQGTVKLELAAVEEVYQSAALEWDTAQLVSARSEMNAASDKRRSLAHELADLTDELPRLQKRLAAAKTAQRHAEHLQDLEQLERCLDEIGPIIEEYRQCAIDLVVLADELSTRRVEINQLRRRTVDWSNHSGAPKCTRDVNAEAAIPTFYDTWLQGGPRNVADARRGLGID